MPQSNPSLNTAQRQSLRNVHYALLISDTESGAAYENPARLVGAINAKITPASNQEKLHADNGVFDLATSLGDIAVEIELATLPLSARAILLGHDYEGGVLKARAGDEPPYLALGFMTEVYPGRYQFVWLFKGKFSLMEDEYGTATDTAAWRTPKLTATFVKREYDGLWQAIGDSGDPLFTCASTWFEDVDVIVSGTP